MRLIEQIVYADRRWGTRELARELNLNKSTVHRLLKELTGRGFLLQDEETQRYSLGPGFYGLAATAIARYPLVRVAQPVLRDIVQRCNESIYLCLFDRGDLIFLDKVDCSHAIRQVIEIGRQGNAHAGAAGKAILAFRPPDEVERLLTERRLPPVTGHTTQDRGAFLRDLEEIRSRGYAVTYGERIADAVGIASPVLDAQELAVGSLVLTMPQSRFTPDRLEDLCSLVTTGASRLSTLLGLRPPT